MSVCVLALFILLQNRILPASYYIVTCGLSVWLYRIFSHYLINDVGPVAQSV